jgi:hypothetical protein
MVGVGGERSLFNGQFDPGGQVVVGYLPVPLEAKQPAGAQQDKPEG